jgi:hypothetical protein
MGLPPPGPFQSCTPDETSFASDPTHAMIPTQFYIDYFQKRIKKDPSKVLVSGVIAPYGSYELVLDAGGVPIQGNSCTGMVTPQGLVFGQPVPRWQKFFGAFGQNAVTASICDPSYAGAMRRIGELIGRKLGAPCVDGQLADKSMGDQVPIAPPAIGQILSPHEYDCSVEDIQNIGTPQQRSAGKLQPCDPMGQPSGACFALIGTDAASCPRSNVKVFVCRNGFDPNDPLTYCPEGSNVAPDNDTAVISCATIP